MTTIFLVSLLIFLIYLPFILIIILLSLISKLNKNIEINYSVSGFYKISNLEIRISDSNKTIILFFKNIGIELIWFRIRIQIKNFYVIGNLDSIEDQELNDLIKMVMTKIRTNGIPFADLQNNNNFIQKKKKYFEKIVSLLDNYTNYDKKEKEFNEIERLEDINKNQPKISLKEKIITQLIILFDIIIVHSELYFELNRSKCSYLIQLEKLHFGGLKGQNRLNDYNFYGFLNEVNLFEYKALNIDQEPKIKRNNNQNLRETLFFDEEKMKFPQSQKSSVDINDSQQKMEDPFHKLIHKFEENMHRIHLINLKQLVFKISFYNGFVFLRENKSPNSNSMGTKVEINNLTLNLSTKSIKALIKNLIQLILIGKRDEIIKRKIDEIILDEVIPIEKIVYNEMLCKMKKFKLLIKNINVNFKAKNNLSTDFIIRINKFSFLNLINLIYMIDPLNQKLVNNSIDLRFQDLCILADENSYILNVPNYNLNISEEIFYIREKKESQIKRLIASDLSNFYIYTHTEKLNKILENVIEIVDGVDKIDCLTVTLNRIERFNCEAELNLNFKNFNISVFNENLMLNIRNLTMFLKIDQVKFSNDDITIAFSPFILTISNPFDTNLTINNITSRLNFHEKSRNRMANSLFDRKSVKNANYSDNSSNNQSYLSNAIFETNEFYYVSDIMLQNFKIEINESKTLSSIKITFGTTNLRIYDNHLMDVMSFLPTFLGYIFEGGKRNRIRLFKNKPRPFKSNKQDKVLLILENVNLVKIIDFNDIISCSFNDMELLADKHLRINRLTFYHRNPTNLLSKQKSKFLDIQLFMINFNEGNVKISFDEIKIYYYCLELSFMITKLSTYYQFFPEWLDYHLDWQFMIDDNKREKLIFENARISTVDIFFKFISIEIKENNIATCSLFDTDLQTLVMEKADNKTVKHALKTLKAIKKDYSSLLIVRNFDLRVYDYVEIKLKNYQDKINFEDNFIYYDTVSKTSEVNLFFREVSFLNHSKKILELKDLNLSIKDNKLFNNFNPNRVMSWVLVQNNYYLHHRQIYKERVLNSQMKIDIPNIFINLYNIKLFDRTIAFAFKSVKVISNFPFDVYVPYEFLEMKKITTYSRLTIIVENFIASINSLQEFENNLVAKMRKDTKKEDKDKAKSDLNSQKTNLPNAKIPLQKRASKTELPPPQLTQMTNPTQKINLDFLDSQKNQDENSSELKLDLKISLCAIDLVNTPDTNSMEITCFTLKFGFDDTQNVDGFPLMVLPVLELNYDLSKNILRVNIPSKEMERKKPVAYADGINGNNALRFDINSFNERNNSLLFNEQKLELQRFLHETKSFTLFIYYEYLEASTKIFENFLDRWNMTLKKYFKTEEKKIDCLGANAENANAVSKNSNAENLSNSVPGRNSYNRLVKNENIQMQQEMNNTLAYKTSSNLKELNETKINTIHDMLNNTSSYKLQNNNFISLDNLNRVGNLNKLNKGDSNLLMNSFNNNNNNYNIKNNSLAIINDHQTLNTKRDQSAFKTSKNLPAYLEKSNRNLSSAEKAHTNNLTSVDEKISNLYKNTANLRANSNNNKNALINQNHRDLVVNLGLEEKKPEATMQNKYLKLKYGDNIPKFKTNIKKEEDKKEADDYSMQLFVALFDLKIIYYVNYKKEKKEFESIFSLDSGTKQRDFFGYIIRIHSSSLSFKKTPGTDLEESKDKLKVKMNLFSMSYLEHKNMNDDLYFKNDEDIAKYFRSKREIQALLNSKINKNNNLIDDSENYYNPLYNNNNLIRNQNNNLNAIVNYNALNNNSYSYINAPNYNEIENIDEFYKNIKRESEFLRFMELKKSFKYKYLNDITFDYFDIKRNKEEDRKNFKSRNLSVESTNAIIKIINVNFKRISMKKSEDMLIKVNRFEILYNKYNKDLIQLIIFEDVLKIVDKIILKIDLEKESDEEANETLDAKSELTLKNEKSNNKQNLTLNKIDSSKLNKQELNMFIIENKEAEGSPIRKKTGKSKKSKKQVQPQTTLNTGLLKFYFSLRNPKIRIENEIKGSHIILVSEEECSVELSDICLDSAKKDFILNINLKKMNLLSYTKSVKHTNKIVESPEINFSILNRLESKFDKIESSNEISISVAKIRGFFQAKDFQDFYNILEILLYDRTESYAVEKKKIGDKIDVLKGKKKLSEIKALIERKTAGGENQFENNNPKILKKIKFNVNEVDLALKQDNETKIQLIITQFYGEQVIWDRKDRKSRSKVFLGDVKLISNLDDKYQNRYLLRKLETGRNTNSLNFPEIFSIPVMNLQPLISLEKQDKYIILEKEDLNLDKVTEWYYINDFKILLQPLSIDIHKSQIEFLLNFFKLNKSKEEEDNPAKAKKVENPEEEYPIYFKEVNVSPSEMKLNFNYAEESLMNIRNASIKIGTFLKANKFYSMQDLVDRFKSHCKLQLMKMIPDIVSSIFGTNVEQENANIEENNVRKALFGEK